MLNPIHLRTLMEVIKYGSFATAANHLGYTASAVSQQMAALERATGKVLFQRTARSIRPTAIAHTVAARGTHVLIAIERLQREVGTLPGVTREHLHLGVFPSAVALLPRVIADPRWQETSTDLTVEVAESSELMTMLTAADALDLAIVYRFERSAFTWPGRFEGVHLGDDPFLLVLPRSWPEAVAEDLRLADLAEAPWLQHMPGTSGALAIERVCAGAGFHPRVVARCDEYTATLELVAAGLGVALVPRMALRQPLDAVRVRDLGAIGGRGVFALLRDGADRRTNIIDLLLKLLHEHFK